MPMTVHDLVETQQTHTGLRWVAGQSGAQRRIAEPDVNPVDQVGYLNLMHGQRISVIGPKELQYFAALDEIRRERVMNELFESDPPALIVCEGLLPDDDFIARCNLRGQPLLASSMPSARVIESLRFALTRGSTVQTSLHGVLMDVLGMGVLIAGDSGLGKSELALELISRGHGLVADDVVEIHRTGPNSLEGRCPALLSGLLEVRGLGLLDIKTIFGETAVRRKMRLKLIVQLIRRSTMDDEYERLPLEELSEDILGVGIRKVVIPVAAGRNIAVLTEAAVRTTILLLRGIDTTRDFVQRQQRAIAESVEDDFDADLE